MIRLQDLESNGVAYLSVQNMRKNVRAGVKSAFHDMSKSFISTSRHLMKTTEKNYDRGYRVTVRGKTFIHFPSRPLHPAAILSGALADSVRSTVSNGAQMQFGAGEKGGQVDYAKKLEVGIGVVKRPYLLPAIIQNDRNAQTYLERRISENI